MQIAFGIFIGLIPFTLIGLLFFVQVFIRPKQDPMDNSNRIGHLRLVWFALKSPHKFVHLYYEHTKNDNYYMALAFPWLEKDEGDIVDGAI